MSRFGFKFKKCERMNTYNLDCYKKLYIGTQSCAIYGSKYATNLYCWNLTRDQWYEIIYDDFGGK